MFCLLNISDLGLWQNDTRKNPAEMSLVWINLHHLEAGGSILIEEAAMIQWPLTPRVTGNKYSRIASVASSDYLFTPLSPSLYDSRYFDGLYQIITMQCPDTITRVSVSIRRGWPHCGVMSRQ